jgi:hypothetical protein
VLSRISRGDLGTNARRLRWFVQRFEIGTDAN